MGTESTLLFGWCNGMKTQCPLVLHKMGNDQTRPPRQKKGASAALCEECARLAAAYPNCCAQTSAMVASLARQLPGVDPTQLNLENVLLTLLTGAQVQHIDLQASQLATSNRSVQEGLAKQMQMGMYGDMAPEDVLDMTRQFAAPLDKAAMISSLPDGLTPQTLSKVWHMLEKAQAAVAPQDMPQHGVLTLEKVEDTLGTAQLMPDYLGVFAINASDHYR